MSRIDAEVVTFPNGGASVYLSTPIPSDIHQRRFRMDHEEAFALGVKLIRLAGRAELLNGISVGTETQSDGAS